MNLSRRAREPAVAGRDGRAPVRPATPAVPGARLLGLQASAGNLAVTGLLGVHRQPDPAPDPAPEPEIPIAERVADAKELVTKGDIDAPAFAKYRASTTGTVADVVQRLWRDDLYLVDVDLNGVGIAKKADRKLVQDLKALVQARVAKTLTAKLVDLRKQIATSGPKISDQIDSILKEAPMWAEGPVANTVFADRLYDLWVGPVPIGNNPPAGARDLWSALQNAAVTSVRGKRKERMAPAAVKALDATEVGAVKTLLDPSTTWVVTPADTDDLTDKVAAALSRPTNHADTAWKELRGRMSTLIHAAETEVVNATIPQSSNKLKPESWATFRDRYVATTTKPIWTYHRDNIVDAEILGVKYSKSVAGQGMHKDVVAALPLLEQSAMRLGGFKTKADLLKANQRPGSEFRFEAMSHPPWMSRARHLSFHGTGRAMDFRAYTNPDFGGATHQLVSILGGGELSELSAGSTTQRAELQKVATHNADVTRMRNDLQAQLATETDAQKRTQLESDIKRLDDHLRDSVLDDPPTTTPANELTKRVRGRARETHAKVKEIEARFQSTWAAINLMRAMPFVDESMIVAMIGQQVDDAANEAKRALEAAKQAKSPDVATLQRRVARIEEVQKLLNDPKQAAGRTEMLAKTESLSRSGITDMPSWMIEAFAERGWQWGMWGGFADAMHFDYMGPVADVRPEAQYL
jgi:hypothetical protein